MLLASLVQACSTLPDDKDMTGVDIVDIVKNVRCEFKEAVAHYPPKHVIHSWTIGYAFTFTATEENGLSADGALVFPISNGTFRIGFDAAKTRERRGLREISLAEQISNVRGLDCLRATDTASHRYPILGKVGLSEVVGRLAVMLEEKGIDIGDFNQELEFILRIGGGLHPEVTIVPAPGHLRNFGLDATAAREDKHKLLVTFNAPPKRPRAQRIEIVNFDDLKIQAPPPGDARGPALGPQEAAPPRATGRAAPASPAERGNAATLRKLDAIRSRRIDEDTRDEVER